MPERNPQTRTVKSRHRALQPAACAIAFCLVALLPPNLAAQGCAQCRDNTASTSPATQRAFRHSIEFMVAAAATFFGATFLAIRRTR